VDTLDRLAAGNARFARRDFDPALRMMPSAAVLVIGCVDPRVDPSHVFGMDLGDRGWNFVVLQHTDCGIVHMQSHPRQLADYFGVNPGDLSAKKVSDPYAAVALDVAALRADPNLPAGMRSSGWVYDTATGRTQLVVPPPPTSPCSSLPPFLLHYKVIEPASVLITASARPTPDPMPTNTQKRILGVTGTEY
jgi:carbonic anhydrase